MINKISLSNKTVNFSANISTRELLELADNVAYSAGSNGKPKLERLQKDKFERVSRYKKKHGDHVYEIYRSCTRKIKRFANEVLAEKEARAMQRRLGGEYSTYYCPICEQWHIFTVKDKYKKP